MNSLKKKKILKSVYAHIFLYLGNMSEYESFPCNIKLNAGHCLSHFSDNFLKWIYPLFSCPVTHCILVNLAILGLIQENSE